MKIRNLIYALLAMVVLCAGLPAQQNCTSVSLSGTWAYTLQGIVYPFPPAAADAVPVMGTGLLLIDQDGKFSGPLTFIQGGEVLDLEVINGTITVDPDCRGTLKYGCKLNGMTLPGQWIERVILFPDKSGDNPEMATISVSSPLSKPSWLSTCRRILPYIVRLTH